jgi:hypothetical protein
VRRRACQGQDLARISRKMRLVGFESESVNTASALASGVTCLSPAATANVASVTVRQVG